MKLDTGPEIIFEGISFTREEETFTSGAIFSKNSGCTRYLKRNIFLRLTRIHRSKNSNPHCVTWPLQIFMFCITTKPTCLCSWHIKAKDGMCKRGKDAISTVCIYCINIMLAGTEVCLSWRCVKYSHYLSIPSPLERSTSDKIFLCLRSTLKILSSPSAAAKCKTELPWRSRRLTSAPALSKSSTTSACLVITARCNGVYKGQSQEKISSRNRLNPQKLLLWEDVPPAQS